MNLHDVAQVCVFLGLFSMIALLYRVGQCALAQQWLRMVGWLALMALWGAISAVLGFLWGLGAVASHRAGTIPYMVAYIAVILAGLVYLWKTMSAYGPRTKNKPLGMP
jgi:hypothetical protein